MNQGLEILILLTFTLIAIVSTYNKTYLVENKELHITFFLSFFRNSDSVDKDYNELHGGSLVLPARSGIVEEIFKQRIDGLDYKFEISEVNCNFANKRLEKRFNKRKRQLAPNCTEEILVSLFFSHFIFHTHTHTHTHKVILKYSRRSSLIKLARR